MFYLQLLKREDVFVTSKLWNTKHHPDDVEAACTRTLSDLRLNYLDLYQINYAKTQSMQKFKRCESAADVKMQTQKWNFVVFFASQTKRRNTVCIFQKPKKGADTL